MELEIEASPYFLSGDGLKGSALRIAPEKQAGPVGQPASLNPAAVLKAQPRPGGDVAACLDDAVVPERDPDAGIGADQAPLADGDALLPPPDIEPRSDAEPGATRSP